MAAADLWRDRSLPVLVWIAAHEEGEGIAGLAAIAEETGLTPAQIDAEVERLASDGLIQYTRFIRTMGPASSWGILKPRITGEGARRLGLWPTVDQLLDAVERMADQTADPKEQSRWRALASAIRDVGVPVLTQTLEAYVKSKMRLPPS
jgi:predicted ArsR family transcriptional regulator